MADFKDQDKNEYTDLGTVESQRNDLTAEEFPEGPYGSSLPVESLGKSTPWRKGQRVSNPYGYENRSLHDGMERNYPPDYEPNADDSE